MFRLIKSKGPARTHGPKRAYRPMHTTTGEDNRVTKLKIHISEAVADGGRKRLQALRDSDLYHECYEWGKRQAITASTSTDGSQHTGARNAAAVHTICYALDAYTVFATRYEATPISLNQRSTQGKTDFEQVFLRQIHAKHRNDLLEQFHATFQKNDEERRQALLSSLSPSLRERLSADGVIKGVADQMDRIGGESLNTSFIGLSEAELLALLDYLSSSSGTFNIINGAAMAHAYYGEPALQSCVNFYSTTLNSAIDKLCKHPWFARSNITVYKGIRLTTLDEPFRTAMLREAYQQKGLVSFPSVLSASCDENSSYARTKFSEGYGLECVITMRQGLYADPFHDIRSMGEHEILGPARQRFKVQDRSSMTVSDPQTGTVQEVDRYHLQPAD